MEYLDFELPIKELEDQLDKCLIIGQESEVDVTNTCKQITKKLEETKRKIYKNLTAWQRVQLSRHPNRPYTLDHVKALCGDTFLELHGDRGFKDDKAMIGGLEKIDGQSFMIIGQQKGYNTKTRQYRNFGMANPEGYRKALRLMKMAEKFGIPVDYQDERLTTAQAEKILIQGHTRRENRKKYIDKLAAVLILQNYLDSHTLGHL